jgi:hypothetical protein
MYKLFDKHIKGKRIGVFLIAVVLVIAQWLFLEEAFAELESEKIIEKRIEISKGIDRLTNLLQIQLDIDDDWGEYDYQRSLSAVIASYDSDPMTYAALYQLAVDPGDADAEIAADGTLYDLRSERTESYTGMPFIPLAYPEVASAVTAWHTRPDGIDRGQIIVWFDPDGKGGEPGRDMYIFFRWFPAPESVDNPYLILCAISKYSVETTTAEWVAHGTVASGLTLIAVDVILLGYIMHIIGRRRECETVNSTR